MKKISHLLEYLFLKFLAFWVNLLPFWSLDYVAKFLTLLLWPIGKSAKKRIRDNLSFALPEIQGKDLQVFMKKNIQHSIRVSLEVMQAWKFQYKRFIRKYVYTDDPDFDSHYINLKKRPIIIEGHFGNWELPVPYMSHLGIRVTAAAKEQSNPYVTKLIEKRRKYYGGEIVYIHQTARIMKRLKENDLIGLVADQDAGHKGVFVKFFGKLAATYAGPAFLAYYDEREMTLFTCVFQGRGKYLLRKHIIAKQVKKSDYPDVETAVQDLTQKWSSKLEEEIRKNPEQYFWLHRRWKTRPPWESNP
ncbi:MAG: hypothetical protein D6767_09970 [Candidatus Hydrogenedentota bacterium]|nr:MAG: hypothetical protein D6767_09970 [Candidatus Hydrogenedentota bacterium]